MATKFIPLQNYREKPSLLYITDLYYPARNRVYYTEDLFLTSKLKDDFDILLCHPLHSRPFEKMVDMVVIRNSGPVIYYKEYFEEFKNIVKQEGILTYNPLTGKGDMAGKNYMIELFREHYPVIPTIDRKDQLHLLPATGMFVCKPKEGADSIGLKILSPGQLEKKNLNNSLIQPFIDFEYEVSFYFIDAELMYALYAPDKTQRWQLTPYNPTAEDISFAHRFISWNGLSHGIQRVDACRTREGELLLVELEDLNPFLSLDLVDEGSRNRFVEAFSRSLLPVIRSRKQEQ